MASLDSQPKDVAITNVFVALQIDNGERLTLAQRMGKEDFLAIEKKIRWKLDVRLLCMAWVMYFFNYLDRSALGAAKVIGLPEDLDISSHQYNVAMMLLFAGYLSMQVPSNMFLAKTRPSIYLPVCMVIWGAISCAAGFVHNAAQLYATRFCLGFIEAPFVVGCLFLISSWYTRAEMAFRSAVLMSAPMLANAFSGVIGAVITSGMDGALGLDSWRWLFILGGGSTVIVAVISLFLLPDFPSTTRWLSTTERAVAEWRLICDAGQLDENDITIHHGFWMTVQDLRLYLFAFMYLFLMIGSSIHNFFPTVVHTIGFSRSKTLWLTAPPYVVGAIIAVGNALWADRSGNASFHVIGPMVAAIVGFAITAACTNRWIRYAGTFLMISGSHGATAVVLAWTQKTLLRPRMKRACAVAIVNTTGTIAQIITSYAYPDRFAPRYVVPMSLNATCGLGAILLTISMRVILQRANKKLEISETVGAMMEGESLAEPSGVSDKQRQEARGKFRYVT